MKRILFALALLTATPARGVDQETFEQTWNTLVQSYNEAPNAYAKELRKKQMVDFSCAIPETPIEGWLGTLVRIELVDDGHCVAGMIELKDEKTSCQHLICFGAAIETLPAAASAALEHLSVPSLVRVSGDIVHVVRYGEDFWGCQQTRGASQASAENEPPATAQRFWRLFQARGSEKNHQSGEHRHNFDNLEPKKAADGTAFIELELRSIAPVDFSRERLPERHQLAALQNRFGRLVDVFNERLPTLTYGGVPGGQEQAKRSRSRLETIDQKLSEAQRTIDSARFAGDARAVLRECEELVRGTSIAGFDRQAPGFHVVAGVRY